jgi:oxygen-independent coproporphyrinogen-3 oxidase
MGKWSFILCSQQGGINRSMNYSIYLHIPFCKHRCHYCDFNTYAGKESLIPGYIDAIIDEIRIVGDSNKGLNVHSIYFGGGTPSLIPINLYDKLLKVINFKYTLTEDCEISLEANPGTLNLEYLSDLHALGFNRISIGVQSMNNFDLYRLDRIHDVYDIFESVYFARKAGFTNINLDLIFGLPWQNLKNWKEILTRALDLKPEHFSIYSLIIEPGTMLNTWYEKGKIELKNEDLEAEMYEYTMEKLNCTGYSHYEISNWAKNNSKVDYRCRHNMQYWLNKPYLGFGAGAHGYADHIRTVNAKRINDYIKRIREGRKAFTNFPYSPANILFSNVTSSTQMKDFMLLGLRLIEEGVSEERFDKDFGESMIDTFDKEVQSLINKDLIEWSSFKKTRLILTKKGILLANQAFMEFV